jgi:hypothetical protein
VLTGHTHPSRQSAARRKSASGSETPTRMYGRFNPSVLGTAAHEVIAGLASTGVKGPDFERVTTAVRAHPANQLPGIQRQAARQWLTSTAMLYFRLFALPPAWELLGVEVQGPHCCFDMVWQDASTGQVLVDELKTGKAGDLVGGHELDQQLDRELRGGNELYQHAFVGIRLLILATPRRSLFLAPDAGRSLLYPERSND